MDARTTRALPHDGPAREAAERGRAEGRLPASEERFRTVVKHSRIIAAECDRDLRYRWIHHPHPDFDRSAVLGRRDDELEDSDGTRRLVALKQRVLETGTGDEEEISFERSDGTRTYHLIVEPLRDAAGAVVGLTSAAVDVTDRRRAEDGLRFQAHVLDLLGQAAIATDMDGRIVYWNRAAEALYGWRAEEVLGRPILEVTPSTVSAEQACAIMESLASGNSWEGEFEVQRRDGSTFRAYVTDSPVFLDGRQAGVIGLSRDVTEQTRLRALVHGQKRVLELVATGTPLPRVLATLNDLVEQQSDGMPCSILLVEEDGLRFRAVASSPSLEGYGDAVDGASMAPPYLGPCCMAAHRREPVVVPDVVTDPRWSGAWRDLALSYGLTSSCSTPILASDGTVLGTFALFGTEPGRPFLPDPQLIEVATHLAGIAIERHNSERKLAAANRRKDEFLAMVSHELRNPLAPIASAVSFLEMERARPDQREAVALIARQTAHLTRLVDDLLEVSRVTSGGVRLHLEHLSLSGVVRDAVEMAHPQIQQHRHRLTMSLPPLPVWVSGDAERLKQVLVNLLGNAAKYTAEGGHIQLELLQEAHEAVLRVRDSGIGIEPQLLPRIFDLFTQAEQGLARSQGGLGLGLSLVRSLVEMHGGRVEARSPGPGQGSEFIVRLPAAAAPAPSRTTPPSSPFEPPVGAPLRILAVDDNLEMTAALGMLMRRFGHEMATANEGADALEAVSELRPDVVLLDIGLPDMDGYEVASRIRQDPALGAVVLVALTGYGMETDRLRSREAGFDHHLTKPADIRKLRQILDAVARAKAARAGASPGAPGESPSDRNTRTP
jgi:PAS domain S-box-containing protein